MAVHPGGDKQSAYFDSSNGECPSKTPRQQKNDCQGVFISHAPFIYPNF